MTSEWSEQAIRILEERYLHDGETPDEMLWRVATEIANGDPDENIGNISETAQKFYNVMSKFLFMPNSPTLMNAGLNNGLQYSACYVLPVPDSLHYIMQAVAAAADIHKTGGGTGFSFTRLRPKNSRVKTSGGVASGPVSFMRIFDAATGEIKQGGRRRGANMGVLRVDHPDIEMFIECKLNGGITNFNISVGITKAFMEALVADDDYDLIAEPGWPGPDGIRYKGGEVIGQKNARNVFDKIISAAWYTGDPGLIFLDRINEGPQNPVPDIGLIEATNPCVTGDTLIYTETGMVEAQSLYYDGSPARLTLDTRRSKQIHRDASPVTLTGRRMVYKLRTKEGYSLRLTADHRVMTERGWVEAQNLEDDDKIHILNSKGGFGSHGSYDLGITLGWLVGDGTFGDNRAFLYFYGEDRALAPMFAEAVNELIGDHQKFKRPYPVSIFDAGVRDVIGSVRLSRIAQAAGVDRKNKHRVPREVFSGTEAMQRGFLQALFTADGTVIGNADKGLSVRLAQSNRKLLEEVQMLLLNFGIASKIYLNRRLAGYRPLPDGHGGLKKYWCKAQHELAIGKVNLFTYQKEIGFLRDDKQAKLDQGLNGYGSRGPYRENFLARFESLAEEGTENVYDLTEPHSHSFVAGGLVVHNCGEIGLLPNEACNLGSINLARHITTADGRPIVDYPLLLQTIETAVHFLDNVITVNPYPLKEIDEVVKANRRIGIGVMGWSDLLFTLKIPYNSDEALTLASTVMEFIKTVGHEASRKLAIQRGPFPNWERSIYKNSVKLRNSTVTAIAPTGSISIIAGPIGSGIEPAFGLVYQHTVFNPDGSKRILTFVNPIFEKAATEGDWWNDALKTKILQTGSLHGLDEVPEHIRDVFVTAHEIDLYWHVKMQATFQKYTDNGVSKTINLPISASPKHIENAYLRAYEEGCIGVTVFRDGCKDFQVLTVGSGHKNSGSPKIRDNALSGMTYKKRTPVGTAYVTINSNGHDDPFEIFINVSKTGSAVAADAEALGRLISLILRLPSSLSIRERIESVVGQLLGIGSGRPLGFGPDRVESLPDGVAQVIAEHTGILTETLPGLPDVGQALRIGDLCPTCGAAALVHEEGCRKCYSCGHSEC